MNAEQLAKDNPRLFDKFLDWAADNDINTENIDDWGVWWLCFYAGTQSCDEDHGT